MENHGTIAQRAARAARWAADGMAEALWPTRCAGCDDPGSLLCDSCTAALPAIEQARACPACGAPFGSLVCTECAPYTPAGGAAPDAAPSPFAPLAGVACYGIHAWPLDRLLRAYKDWGELRLAPLIAELAAAAALRADDAGHIDLADATMLTFVPSTPAAYARRGFDHMEPVARTAASLLGLPFADALARITPRDQRGLGRAARSLNVRGSCVALARLEGERVLLVDDVVTTGATMGEAAAALRLAGAIRVWGVSAARAW